VKIKRLPATSLTRTLRDICNLLDPVEALVVMDMAIRIGRTDKVALWRYAQNKLGLPGSARMRELVRLAEPAESPMETRLRWLLLKAGLPRPQVQVDIRTRRGEFLGRADLYYPRLVWSSNLTEATIGIDLSPMTDGRTASSSLVSRSSASPRPTCWDGPMP
jgi:hypothetical protein